MMKTTAIYLEDLRVGDEFVSDGHRVDAEQIIGFGGQFDPQPFHMDPEAAQDTFFGGLAASGWHTAALTMKLLVASFPLGCGIIGTGGQIEWPRPTRPGDTLRVVSTIQDITSSRSRPDRGLVTVECRTLNQDDRLCQRLVAKLVVTGRPRTEEGEDGQGL
ncbi:MaoC family dehydratase [Microbacterium sp. A93]|uniref:MaoC family dehydratase n=1 Tax=Microbacterium sp. A93 TaxID=3450716 RepID=UPI003F43C403